MGKATTTNVDNIARIKSDIELKKLIGWLDTFSGARKVSEPVKKQFLEICQAYSLNPFKREIHLVPFWDKDANDWSYAPIIGYEVYLKRAERTGVLEGWECHTEGEIIIEDTTYPEKGIITIWRKERSKPFIWEVYFKEVAGFNKKGSLTKFWWKSPNFQLKKVTISQGMRLCFPDEMGGMAYEYAHATDEYEEAEPVEPRATELIEPRTAIATEKQIAEVVEKAGKVMDAKRIVPIPAITIEPEDMPAEPSQAAEGGQGGAFAGLPDDDAGVDDSQVFSQIVSKINSDKEMPATQRIDVIKCASDARKKNDVGALKKILGELNGKFDDSDGTGTEGPVTEPGPDDSE